MDQKPDPKEQKEEKLEFLKRGEIRTMAKDISRLRETEAQKERERISRLKTEEEARIEREKTERKKIEEEVREKEVLEKIEKPEGEKKKRLLEFVGEKTKEIWEKEREERKKFLERLRVKEKPALEVPKPEIEKKPEAALIPKPPKRLSPFQKILVRAIAAIVLFLVLSFFYWLLAVKKVEVPPEEELLPEEEIEEEIPPEEVTPPEEEITEEPEIKIPLVTERILNWGYYIPTATRTIDTIIIHSVYNAIGGNVHDLEKVVEEFRMYGVSPHYLITRDGIIYQLAPDEAVAYHAGVGRMPDGSRVNVINNFSIGIEIVYTETESPNEAQYQILAQLVNYLRQQYNIPSENILGQNEIAPERKTDPWNFNWENFRSLLEE